MLLLEKYEIEEYMQGLIYTVLADMVVELKGMSFWNTTLSELSLPSKGAYTAGEQYADEELYGLVKYLSNKLNLTEFELVKAYGNYLFPILLSRLPAGLISMKNFLLQIDDVIHKEVKRLHPEVYLPEFKYIDVSENELVMLYYSKRKLCSLSEGLIGGAAEYFNAKVEIKHPICMLAGHEHCRLEITMS